MNSGPKQIDPAGSSDNDEPVFIAAAKLRKPHGIKGEMASTVLTDFPELFSPGRKVYLGADYQPLTVRSVRPHRADLLISFEEFPDRSAVEGIRNQLIFFHAEDCPDLPEGEFYFHEVVGLDVISDQGEHLGTIQEVLVTGANDVYLVEREGEKDLLLPAIEEVILDIDLEAEKMIVHLLPGL